ncbi:RNB domain-containing ribonuclease [Gallibacterium anatis]|uniref:RNB domain-containing ribonuclease n=1 Tax=Gallibacterium anatis TaxID=750 RepID=A0A930UV47_9PAST|nr:RNB domain-containing ribonuclease [Gallibacterium anatis]
MNSNNVATLIESKQYTAGDNIGHFGFGFDVRITAFTSPIRRYPDLSLHRGIKYLLAKQLWFN